MIRRVIRWFKTRRTELPKPSVQQTFSREEVIDIVAQAKTVAYNDGKRDGLNIAREQATKSLKEILWQQNTKTPPQK